jgi:hypothetical protein
MISASVLDLELSFWTMDVDMKYPTPNVTHIPEVDFMSSRLAKAASIDKVTLTNGENIIAYGRRAVKTYERIRTSGVPESHFPSPKQQARRFIERPQLIYFYL